jgi:hypothetical protein
MRNIAPILACSAATAAWLIPAAASAKDIPMALDRCPAAVQAIVRHYSTRGSMEEIALDMKKKSGGPPVYEAKFSLPGGKRIEVHITPEGKVLQVEDKKPKN